MRVAARRRHGGDAEQGCAKLCDSLCQARRAASRQTLSGLAFDAALCGIDPLMLVRSRRLELPRGYPHKHLKLARLPFRHDRTMASALGLPKGAGV